MTALRPPETTPSFTAASLTPEGYDKARRLLMAARSILATAIKRIGPCGMAAVSGTIICPRLVGAIVSQQLSTKAAATIFARFLALFPEGEPLSAPAINRTERRGASRRRVERAEGSVIFATSAPASTDGRLDLGELETLPTRTSSAVSWP
jgi:hypothetical protein